MTTEPTLEMEISPGQVKSLQKRGETFTLLDVREPGEWEASRIEGAKHIPMAISRRARIRNLAPTTISSSCVITEFAP